MVLGLSFGMSFLACFEMLSPTGSLKVSYWHGVLIAKGSAEGTYQEETFQGGGCSLYNQVTNCFSSQLREEANALGTV